MAAEIIDVEQIDDEIESVESADIVVPVSNKQGDAQDDPIVCSSDDEAALPPPQQPQQPPLKKARTSDAGGTRRSSTFSSASDLLREEQGLAPQSPTAPVAPAPPPPPVVTPGPNTKQQEVLDKVASGMNVFYTGSAGTGKSFTTKLIIKHFRDHYGDDFENRVAVVAPTGIAAASIGGSTIHRAANVGVPELVRDFGKLFGKLEKPPKNAPEDYVRRPLWSLLGHLIVDEVSMLSGEFWDQLDWRVRELRSYHVEPYKSLRHESSDPTGRAFDHVSELPPFGGIQLIVCGDLLQLPPIATVYQREQSAIMSFDPDAPARVTLDAAARPGGTDRPPGHNISEDSQLVFCSRGRCFESRGFWAAQFHYVKLTECYRQRDRVFSGLLDRLRVGDATALRELNRACVRAADASKALSLFPCNEDADKLNAAEFERLPGAAHGYRASDTICLFQQGEFETGMITRSSAAEIVEASTFDEGTFLAIDEVRLKIGCRVLLLANIAFPARDGSGDDDGVELFNGAQGVLVGWATRDELMARAISDADTLAKGADGDYWKAAADALRGGDAKAAQAALKPLVEAKMTQPVVVAPNDRDDYVAAMSHIGRRHAFATAWLVDCLADGARVPVCQFEDKPEVVVLAELFERECVGYGVARRLQLPLRLAWALSVHKAQGMGLSKVRFDPARTFDDGQAYVALSRCTNMAGLSLVSECRAKHLRCDRRAVEVVEHIDALKRLPKDPPAFVDPWEQQHPQFGRGPVVAGAAGPEAARPPPRCSSATYFAGHTIVFTGEPVHLGRDAWKEFIETRGGFIRGSVSGRTTLLVECSETNALGGATRDGRKSKDARKKGVPKISETGFYDAIESGVRLRECY